MNGRETGYRVRRDSSVIKLDITPVPKPRMTKSSHWNPTPSIDRYWKFKDELVKLWGDRVVPSAIGLSFTIPMPKSWPDKKKLLMDGSFHQDTPDIDNLIKAFFDSLLTSDKHIYRVDAIKRWGRTGGIVVSELDPKLPLPTFIDHPEFDEDLADYNYQST